MIPDRRGTLIDDIERQFHHLIWRGRQRLARRLDAAGLTVPQYVALSMIGKLGPNATMSEVADSTYLPASTMTSVVDRLVKIGLVERGSLPADRRAVVANLTPAGTTVIAAIEAERRRDLVALLDGLDDDDLATFLRLLTWLSAGLDRSISTLVAGDPLGPPGNVTVRRSG